MKSHLLLPALVLAAGTLDLAGCAVDASTEGPAAHSEPVYRTGSNISVGRTGHDTGSIVTISPDDAERVLRPPASLPPRSGTGN